LLESSYRRAGDIGLTRRLGSRTAFIVMGAALAHSGVATSDAWTRRNRL